MTMQEIVQRAISEAGGLNAAARRLGLLAAGSLMRWRDGSGLPTVEKEEALAKLAGVDPAAVAAAAREARMARAKRHHRGSYVPIPSKLLKRPLAKVS